jgi:hypothetical protein
MKCLKYYKDSEKANSYRNRTRKSNYTKGRVYQRERRRMWYPREVALLCKYDLEGMLSDREIAKELERSVQAIQVKRCSIEKTGITEEVKRIIEYLNQQANDK